MRAKTITEMLAELQQQHDIYAVERGKTESRWWNLAVSIFLSDASTIKPQLLQKESFCFGSADASHVLTWTATYRTAVLYSSCIQLKACGTFERVCVDREINACSVRYIFSDIPLCCEPRPLLWIRLQFSMDLVGQNEMLWNFCSVSDGFKSQFLPLQPQPLLSSILHPSWSRGLELIRAGISSSALLLY